MRRAPIALSILLIAACGSGGAQAFGTINAAKQSAEHEMITRRALSCPPGVKSDNSCFETDTLTEIAGAPGAAGAVGYPDLSTSFFRSKAHCDNGDAAGALAQCRAWMELNMHAAVVDAVRLLNAKGGVNAGQVSLGCIYAGALKGRAKCNVLQDLGYTLHASQDFYSHSNWIDSRADTAPAGLGNLGPAPYIDLRTFPKAVPPGLVSGCYDLWGGCGARISHETLNKDKGPIGPAAGSPVGPGITARGNHNANFEHAVAAAAADTQDKWAVLRERLVAAYGPLKGQRMACALTHDNPVRDC